MRSLQPERVSSGLSWESVSPAHWPCLLVLALSSPGGGLTGLGPRLCGAVRLGSAQGAPSPALPSPQAASRPVGPRRHGVQRQAVDLRGLRRQRQVGRGLETRRGSERPSGPEEGA